MGACIFSVALYAAVGFAISHCVNEIVPKPYMDEIFHIPQVQRFCNGRFTEWDDKITTLPGLYVVTVGITKPLTEWTNQWFCDVNNLRRINIFLATLTLPIIYRITGLIHGNKHYYDPNKSMLSSVNMALFPLFYFFSYLYYTDVGSTLMVLLMYCLQLEERDFLASIIGAIAVLFRQTNIIWVAFVAALTAGPYVIGHANDARIQHHTDNKSSLNFRLTTLGQTRELFVGLGLVAKQPGRLIGMALDILWPCSGYISVGTAFLAFVHWNGGVVVGDRTAHAVVFHPTQVGYFCAFSAAFSLPYCLSRVQPFAKACRRHPVAAFFCAALIAAAIEGCTMAHPYLLADNRHYTFYVWRRILARDEQAARALVPVYMFSAFCLLYSLRMADLAFKLAFPVCVVANLTPQHLLEFRYFVVPFLLYRLQIRPLLWQHLVAEFAIFATINAITMYTFLFKTFTWPHEPDQVQRFMW